MSADRELLELAAKAAGYNCKWSSDDPFCLRSMYIAAPSWRAWNPLDDDGDALRISIDLEIYPTQSVMAANVFLHRPPAINSWSHSEPHNIGNRYASTRRAIVLAAAEIGRNTAEGESA